MTETRRRTRHRFLIAWMMFSAIWLAALLIYTAYTRPAPPFATLAPLAVGIPFIVLLAGLVTLALRRES